MWQFYFTILLLYHLAQYYLPKEMKHCNLAIACNIAYAQCRIMRAAFISSVHLVLNVLDYSMFVFQVVKLQVAFVQYQESC